MNIKFLGRHNKVSLQESESFEERRIAVLLFCTFINSAIQRNGHVGIGMLQSTFVPTPEMAELLQMSMPAWLCQIQPVLGGTGKCRLAA